MMHDKHSVLTNAMNSPQVQKMKVFNTTALCIPSRHYMVDISDRISAIKEMVDDGKYFTINRARQYGKTTTLKALQEALQDEYAVLGLSFEGITSANFASEQSFVKAFCRLFRKNPTIYQMLPDSVRESVDDYISRTDNKAEMDELFMTLGDWCAISDRPVVMLIDEIDSAANNQVFLDFLGLLRDGYIAREADGLPFFQSVILAGVTDVKSLKRKIRPEDKHKNNSPWNIAADFDIDMSLSETGIRDMLDEYEADHHTGMDTAAVARDIHDYTEGYPYLVSRICQKIDTQLAGGRFTARDAWTVAGVSEAVRLILAEKNTLFDSLMGKVADNTDLSDVLQRILFGGERIPNNPDNIPAMDGEMYGFIVNRNGVLGIANRIFETRLYNYFLSLAEMKESPISKAGASEREAVIRDGQLDMEKLLTHYVRVFDDLYENKAEPFDEDEGRRRFLLFIRPVINGTGNYYIETYTRDDKRMDLVIDYLGKRFVVELKIWRGAAYHEKGEVQLAGYLDSYHLDTGYLLTYNFNKKKKPGIEHRVVKGKKLIEATV